MKTILRVLAVGAALVAGIMLAAPGRAADNAKPHRIAIQVDQNDPALMNLVLNNVSNLMEYYHSKGEQAQIDVVAYGPGLNMLRDDKSPVKDRIKHIKEGSFASSVAFSACGNTKKGMEKREGHAVPIIAQASVVPSGVVRLSELQEQGWSYIRP
jgi:intracellular sulfur oxidation DsrE/DsrF family protein